MALTGLRLENDQSGGPIRMSSETTISTAEIGVETTVQVPLRNLWNRCKSGSVVGRRIRPISTGAMGKEYAER